MKKRVISVLLCLCIMLGAMMPVMAAQVKTDVLEGTSTADMNHGVLVYTGYNGYSGKKFSTMTDEGIDALLQTTDEILLIPITIYNRYVDKNGVEHQIISEDVINSMTSDMVNYPSYLNSIKTEYLNHASSVIKANYYMEDYVADAAATAKQLVAANPDVKVWLSTTSSEGFHALTHLYAPAWIDLVDDLKAAVGEEIWAKNIMGIYYATEDIVTYQYTKFDTSAVNNDFNSPIVYAMHQVSDAVHAYGKKMLWIPYYHPNNSYIAPQLGHVVNLTNIFDTVILQPSYYFNSEHYNGLSVISKCVEKQAVVNSSGSIIGGKKTSETVIGFEMEINEKYHTDSAYKTRYNAYVSTFSKYVGKYPTAYYASNPDVMIGLTPVIGDFFDINNTATTQKKQVGYYGLPVDSVDQWETWESPSALADSKKIVADVSGGNLKLSFTENGINSSQSFHVRNAAGMLTVQEGDKLVIDIETTGNASDVSWKVRLYFGASAYYFDLSQYIGEAVGVTANSSGQIPGGKYQVELDIAEIIKDFDADNGLSGADSIYQQVFGTADGNVVCGVYFGAKSKNINSEFIINKFEFTSELDVFTTPAYESIKKGVENGADSMISYTFPVNDISMWYAERTSAHESGYKWNAPLTGTGKTDAVNGTVTSDGAMRLTLSGTVQCPIARIENTSSGLTNVSKDDYLNLDVIMEGDETNAIRWGTTIVLNGTSINISKYVAAKAGKEVNSYNQIVPGVYKVSVKFGDVIKAYDADKGTDYYNSFFGSASTAKMTALWMCMYCNNPADYTNLGLVLNSATVSSKPYYTEYEHNYSAVVTAPTCETDGYTTYTCYCGDVYVSDIVKAEGHNYTATVTPPTCETDGYTTYTCDCGHSYVGNVIEAGHKYTSVVTPPTCETDGYTTYTCDCGYSYVGNIVTAKGHTYSSAVTAPTCETDGYTTYTCDCGHSYVGNIVPAKGHNFGEWYTVTEPTTSSKGQERRDCECGEYEVKEIPALPGVECSLDYEIINGKLIITVVTGSNINRIALYDDKGTCIKTFNAYTVNADGAYVWELKMEAPAAPVTYVIKGRDAATNSYKNGVTFPAVTVDPEIVFESVEVDVRGDKVYVIATTVSTNYDRVAVVNPIDNSYVKYTRNYKVVDGKYEWTIFFDYVEGMENLVVKARDIRTNHYNNAQAVDIVVETKVEPVLDITVTKYNSKKLLVTVTTIPDLYRVKIAYADDPTSHIAYARNPVSKTDDAWTWEMLIDIPSETTEYAVDIAYVKAYARYFNYVTYEV